MITIAFFFFFFSQRWWGCGPTRETLLHCDIFIYPLLINHRKSPKKREKDEGMCVCVLKQPAITPLAIYTDSNWAFFFSCWIFWNFAPVNRVFVMIQSLWVILLLNMISSGYSCQVFTRMVMFSRLIHPHGVEWTLALHKHTHTHTETHTHSRWHPLIRTKNCFFNNFFFFPISIELNNRTNKREKKLKWLMSVAEWYGRVGKGGAR